MVMLGAGRLYAPSLRGRRALLLPAGALVYIAIPPARDFATSGLENGLVLAYLGPAVVDDGVLVAGVARLSGTQQRRRAGCVSVSAQSAVRCRACANADNVVTPFFDAALAFVAGLSVLVRPELALVGGARVDHDAGRCTWLAATRADRRRGRSGAGRLSDLPDGLLRPAVPGHRACQGRIGIQMGARLCLPGQLQPPVSAVGARDPARSGSAASRWPPADARGGSASATPPWLHAGLHVGFKVRPL